MADIKESSTTVNNDNDDNDYIHKALKYISYERYKVLAVLLSVGLIFIVGCQQTAIDPVSGKAVTKDELITSVENKLVENKTKAKQTSEIAKKKIADLTAKFNSDILAITSETDITVEELNNSNTAILAKAEDAIKQIEEKENRIQVGLKFLTDNFSSIPYVGMALGGAGLLLAGGANADKKRANDRLAQLKAKNS